MAPSDDAPALELSAETPATENTALIERYQAVRRETVRLASRLSP